jgi:hypothetical protein
MALSSTTIATGIAALSISGVTVKDVSGIPDEAIVRDLPLLFPSPDDFIDGASSEPSTGPATFGTPSTRMWIFNRIFNYIYLHAAVGEGRGLMDHRPGMCTNCDAIITALLTLDLAGIDVKNVEVSDFGELQDASGKHFYGCKLKVTMREKVNA